MKTNDETVAEFTKYLHNWAIIEPELSLIIGNVNRILMEKDKEKEEAVAAEREIIKEIIKISTPVYQGRGATLRQIGGGEMKQILTQAINSKSI